MLRRVQALGVRRWVLLVGLLLWVSAAWADPPTFYRSAALTETLDGRRETFADVLRTPRVRAIHCREGETNPQPGVFFRRRESESAGVAGKARAYRSTIVLVRSPVLVRLRLIREAGEWVIDAATPITEETWLKS